MPRPIKTWRQGQDESACVIYDAEGFVVAIAVSPDLATTVVSCVNLTRLLHYAHDNPRDTQTKERETT